MIDLEMLIEQYLERSWQEGLQIEDFVKEMAAGRHGEILASDIKAWLQRMEQMMLQNIELRAQEGPEYAARAEEVAAETQAMIRRLIDTYARG